MPRRGSSRMRTVLSRSQPGERVGGVAQAVLVERPGQADPGDHGHRRRQRRQDGAAAGVDRGNGCSPTPAPTTGNQGTDRASSAGGRAPVPVGTRVRNDTAPRKSLIAGGPTRRRWRPRRRRRWPAAAAARRPGAAALPQAHAQLQQGLLAQPLQPRLVARLGRAAVAGDGVGQGARAEQLQRRHRGGDHEPVQDQPPQPASRAAPARAASSAPPAWRSTSMGPSR